MKAHGGYRKLASYQTATIIYDLTVVFVDRYVDRLSRTRDQMTQAARSGRQNIAEGSQVSGTSVVGEIRLISVARGSLEELLIDYEDYLRQNKLQLWDKDSAKAQEVRQLAYCENRTERTYEAYTKGAEEFANMMICLIHQASYLLDRLMQALEKDFLQKGAYQENLLSARLEVKGKL